MASECKPFAVVIFEDRSCSEIPTTWLSPDRSKCLWPPNVKNVSFLMAKGVEPDESWNEFDVTVEAYCSSLKRARKKAQDQDYTSADENALGRGKRSKAITHPYNTDSSCDSRESSKSPPPPQLPPRAISHKKSSKVNTVEKVNQNNFKDNIQVIDEIPILSEIPIVIDGVEDFIQSPATPVSIDVEVNKKFDKILEVLHSVHLYVRSIDENLKKIHSVTTEERNQVTAETKFINDLLPIPNIDALKQFEVLLENEGHAKQFHTILSNIGGKSGKDNIHRLLRKVYSNQMSTKCSWLGQRGNFKMSNTKSMQIIKGVIVNSYVDVKESDFEHICSEWFRLAKLRADREK